MLIWLAVLGLCAGSFASALTWRLRNKKDWIRGRSQCPKCSHQLSTADLVPLFSWLASRGRCRYCGRRISLWYPAAELILAANFVLSYQFWPGGLGSSADKFLFIGWLLISVGLLTLALYDQHWQLLPSKILYPIAIAAVFYRATFIIIYSDNRLDALWHWLAAVAVASGVFWVIYHISSGRWIGYGDVRLGLITGSVLASVSKAFLMLFAASLLGILFTLPALVANKHKFSTKVAYGPYLILATALSLIFGDQIINWYEHFWS